MQVDSRRKSAARRSRSASNLRRWATLDADCGWGGGGGREWGSASPERMVGGTPLRRRLGRSSLKAGGGFTHLLRHSGRLAATKTLPQGKV